MLKKYSAISILFLLILAVYSQVVGHEFLNYDDDVFVSANQYVQTGFNLRSIAWAFQADLLFDSTSADYWQPVTILSRLFDTQSFGLNPAAHHLMNLFYHLLNTFLVMVLICELTKSFSFAWLVAAIFALHPLQVQTVCWISARKDLLSTLFSLSALVIYVKKRADSIRAKIFIYIFFALGLMSKPLSAVLPILMIVIDWTKGKMFRRNFVTNKIPLFLMSATVFAVLWLAKTGVTIDMPGKYQFYNIAYNVKEYIFKFFIPIKLYIYSRIPDSELSFLKSILVYVALGIFTTWCIRKKKSEPYYFLGWFWFLSSMAPSILLTRADRFMYFPMIGLSIMSVFAFQKYVWDLSSKLFKIAAITIVVAMMSALSFWQASYWKDNFTLFKRTLELDGQNYRAHNNLASAYSSLNRYEEAIDHYIKSIAANPFYSQAHHNLAVILARKENFHIAEFHYLRAIETNPSFALAYSSLGHLYMEVDEYEKAIQVYKQSLAIEPDSDITRKALGNALAAIGEFEASCEQYAEALKINPNFSEAHHDWGFVLAKQKRYPEAEAHFLEALRIDPDYADVHNKLGVTLAMQGKYERAIYHLKEALRLNPFDKNAAHNLSLVGESEHQKDIIYED